MKRLVTLAVLLLFTYSNTAHAWVFALLGRAAVVSRTTSAVGAVARVGTASRAGMATRSFSWVGREIGSAAIQRALSVNGQDSWGEIQHDQCLVVEFANSTNFVANYCDYAVEVIRFARQDSRGEIGFVECAACVIDPMQYRQFTSNGHASAFLGAEARRSEQQMSPVREVVTPSGGGAAPTGRGKACPFGEAAEWDEWFELNGPGWGYSKCVPSYGPPPGAPTCGPQHRAYWWEKRFGQIVPVACIGR